MRILKLFIVALLAGSAFFLTGCSDSKNHIVSFMHANINCSDLEQSRCFYEMLGFTPVVEGDSEATAEFAAALDMPPYELRFVQMLSKDGSLIDLIEWEDPFDASAPYASINHLGIAHLTLQTSNLDADISILRAHGVAFFSGPAVVDNSLESKRFVCFKDPDGTIIELAETAGFGTTIASSIHITGIMNVNINCSDYFQSRLFYENLGFKVLTEIETEGTPEVADAMGTSSFNVRGALMELRRKGPTLSLLKWQEPYDDSAPYSQLNHLGLARIALMSTDLDADIASLKTEGVEFFSDPATPERPLAFLRFVCLKDPDGTVIELVELFPKMKP
jgi:catechol 2,3-dioxygenase-like lactoylglutathione lyase family enzyme